MTDLVVTPHSAGPDALELVETFARAGVIDSAGRHFSATLLRLAPTASDVVLLGAALAMRAPTWGHVCVDLASIADTVVVDDGGDGSVGDLPWPDVVEWAAAVEVSPLVHHVGHGADHSPDLRPLAFDGGRLYLSRYWDFESAVVRDVRSRLLRGVRRGSLVEPADFPSSFNALFSNEYPSQRAAAAGALTNRFTVITGGPGTGKTYTVAGVVSALLGIERPGFPPLQIALAAPTGKAAQRLNEAVRQDRDGASSTAVDAKANLQAGTIHRLLGAGRGGFRHDAHNPLGADVVIVDETSMVSLPLMSRLLDAVRPDARVILVGDPQQLASVEAGSVLRDLVAALPPTVVYELDHIFRQEASSAIIPLAEAIHRGDAPEVQRLLADSTTPLDLVDPTDTEAVSAVTSAAAEHARSVVDLADDPAAALATLGSMRVLTASRKGPNGRGIWTYRIESAAGLGRRSRTAARRWYQGRPIIVTQNDYLNGLMNGDVGVTTSNGEVAFEAGEDVRLISPTRLDAVETVWAMTIHKSQGSEFDRVVVTLPDTGSPLLTRELLYTAVTRAKQSVTIVATESALVSAVERSISRSSGLVDRLTEALAPAAVQSDQIALPGLGTDAPAQLRLWE